MFALLSEIQKSIPLFLRVKTCNPPDFRFYLGKLNKKKQPHMAHCYFRVCFHHNKQYKKANIVNNIAVILRNSYQTKLSVESRDSRTVILSDGRFISHKTTIVDSFYYTVYISLFKIMHALLNQYYTENRSILGH